MFLQQLWRDLFWSPWPALILEDPKVVLLERNWLYISILIHMHWNKWSFANSLNQKVKTIWWEFYKKKVHDLFLINVCSTLSQIWKKIPFWFWLFSLLPYKKCNLAAASHAPRRLAGMKIRKIILCYCAQWCSSS